MTGFLVLLGIWWVSLNGDAVRRVLRLNRAAEPQPTNIIARVGRADYEDAA